MGRVCFGEGRDFGRVKCHRVHSPKEVFSVRKLISIACRSVVIVGDLHILYG